MTDLTMWDVAPFNATVEHIVSRYHNVHRQQLSDLVALSEKVASVHGEQFPTEMVQLLKEIQAELSNHMMKEERVLFPMINQGVGRGAEMPIRMMMSEHTDHEAYIQRLLEVTNNLTAPEAACGSWRSLYEETQTFINDLHDHIDLENNHFFPRVLAS